MLNVSVLCRNYHEDRVIPRFSRYLSDNLGWTVTTRKPDPAADVIYLSGYFEAQLLHSWPGKPVVAYFTHKEVYPPNNGKAKLFVSVAKKVNLRIATAVMYAKQLVEFGPTVQCNPPVERHRFVIPKRGIGKKLVCGFSGYSYSNGRKGENLARQLIRSNPGRSIEWVASGRGWPVPTKRFKWSDMPAFYQSLDILVVTSLVEGVPMPPLEVLSCGGSIVVPNGVGLLDELPNVLGIHRYKRGNIDSLVKALNKAIKARQSVDKKALRAVTEPYSILAWCEQHRQAFEELFL
jgi:hypothetical protein